MKTSYRVIRFLAVLMMIVAFAACASTPHQSSMGKSHMESALEGGSLKKSVAEQKKIDRYFHAVVVPKLKPCWDQLQGKGTIKMMFRYEDNAKGEWAFKTLEGGKSNLPKGQDDAALACMQKAVTAISFPREKSDTGTSYSINWDWPVPLPRDAAQRVERMLGSGGGEGTGCYGEASARCVKCSGSNGAHSCPSGASAMTAAQFQHLPLILV